MSRNYDDLREEAKRKAYESLSRIGDALAKARREQRDEDIAIRAISGISTDGEICTFWGNDA